MPDPGKAVEAQALVAEADKALKTGLFKRSPDFMAAEAALSRAGGLFKAAGMLDSALLAWKRAAEAAVKSGNVKKAVVTLETAARELQATGSMSSPLPVASRTQAAALLAEAGSLLYESDELPRAADLKLRVSAMVAAAAAAAARCTCTRTHAHFQRCMRRGHHPRRPYPLAAPSHGAGGKAAGALRHAACGSPVRRGGGDVRR